MYSNIHSLHLNVTVKLHKYIYIEKYIQCTIPLKYLGKETTWSGLAKDHALD